MVHFWMQINIQRTGWDKHGAMGFIEAWHTAAALFAELVLKSFRCGRNEAGKLFLAAELGQRTVHEQIAAMPGAGNFSAATAVAVVKAGFNSARGIGHGAAQAAAR